MSLSIDEPLYILGDTIRQQQEKSVHQHLPNVLTDYNLGFIMILLPFTDLLTIQYILLQKKK